MADESNTQNNTGIIKQILTEDDNTSYVFSRVMTMCMAAAMIIIQGYTTYKHGTFDCQAFGIACGSLLAGGGIARKLSNPA